MATIKIKFKDTLTFTSSATYNLNFTSNGNNYTSLTTYWNSNKQQRDMQYGSNDVVESGTWLNGNFKIIEVDPTQASFSTFITAFKTNIDGVLLESGTYVWINKTAPFDDGYFPTSTERKIVKFNFKSNNIQFVSCGVSAYGAGEFHFAYGKSTATITGNTYLDSDVSSGKVVEVCNTEAYDFWVGADAYRTIILDTDQYVDYDFYSNYVGGKLNKQATEITYTCKWYLDGTLVNTSTFTHEQLTGVDYNVLGSVFKVMLSASVLAQYDYGVNLNGETSNASLGTDNVITIEAFQSNIVFNITSNGTTTLATKNTYVPCDIDFNVNVPVPSVPLQDSKLVELSMADGSNQNVMPDTNYTAMKQVIIVKPTALVAGNIRNGISIAGISGSFTADANALSGNILSGKTAYVRGSKVTGSIPTYSGTTNVTSNQTLETSGKYMPSNIVINVPNPTLSGNALASQVLKGQKFYSNSYTILTGTMEIYSGTYTITQNGTYSTSGKYMNSDITVDVAGITEVATSAEMDAKLKEDNVSLYFKYTGTTDDKYTNGDIYQVQDEE